MKALLVGALLVGSLQAEPSHWEVVSAVSSAVAPAPATWTFTLRNVSDRALEVGEHWSAKGCASANVCFSDGPPGSLFAPRLGVPGAYSTLIAEPCHQPRTLLRVEPGETVRAVVQRMGDKDRLGLVITEGKERVMVALLSQVLIKGDKLVPEKAPGVPPEEPAKK